MSIIGEVETVAEGATGTWWVKLIPYALAFAGAAALLYGAYRWSFARGVDSMAPQITALSGTITNLKLASAQAAAKNLSDVRATETRQDAITKENTDALTKKLADAGVAAAAYVRLHPAPRADRGNAGNGGVPQAADAAGPADGADPEAVVPASDVAICNANTVIAEGWQQWWLEQAAAADAQAAAAK